MADLSAHRVFLLIEAALLRFGDMAAVVAGHVALLMANLSIFLLVETARLLPRHFTVLNVLMDAVILVF